jgi:uncharacterized protein (UPF0332 family)
MLEFSWDRPVREAALRSAVSRAYYAAFHCARLRAEAEGESIPEKGEAHGTVIRYFRLSSDRDRKDIARALEQLRDDRNEADYQTASSVASNARDILLQTQRVLKMIAALPPVKATAGPPSGG